MVLTLANGYDLRYVDERLMGKVYLVEEGALDQIPQFAEMGPDALSPELTDEVFAQRLRRHPGQIKGILVNHKFVAGIGNAYADEILFAASIHPYRKRPTLIRGGGASPLRRHPLGLRVGDPHRRRDGRRTASP